MLNCTVYTPPTLEIKQNLGNVAIKDPTFAKPYSGDFAMNANIYIHKLSKYQFTFPAVNRVSTEDG